MHHQEYGSPSDAKSALAAARLPRQHLLDFDCDAIAIHQHDAAGHRKVVGQHLDLVGLGRVKLDDGAATEAQHLMNRHCGGPKDHHQIDRDFIESWHLDTAQRDWIAGFNLTTLWLANG